MLLKQQPINPMKTNPSLKIFKLPALAPLAIAIAAALLTQPVRATAINSLVITENSSTSLTAMLTLNGTTHLLPVANTGPDLWFIGLAGFSNPSGINISQNWTEPDAAGVVNNVTGQPEFQRISVASDFGSGLLGLPNGTTDMTSFTLNGNPIWVTFNDNGDVAAAPDTGSTLGLLSLSVIALLGATRFRSLRLA